MYPNWPDNVIRMQQKGSFLRYWRQALVAVFLFTQGITQAQLPCPSAQIDSLILLSRAFTDEKKFDQALEINQLAEKDALAQCGKNSVAYASTCFNHGRILYFNGHYEAAKNWYIEAKAIREQLLGQNHKDYTKSLNNLAIVYDLLHEFEQSVPLYQQALVLREKLYGRLSNEYADVLSNLATAYMEMGLYEKSEKYTLEALRIRAEVLGNDDPDYAASLQNLANLYFEMGNYDQAASYYQQSNAHYSSAADADPELIAKGMDNLANVRVEQAEYEQAEALYLKSLAIRDTMMRTDHPAYQKNVHDLAYLYSKKGEYSKAQAYFEQLERMKEQIKATDISLWALTAHNRGNLFFDLKEYDKAEHYLLESKAVYEKAGLVENKWYIAVMESLARTYQQTGQLEQAQQYFNSSATLYKNLIIKASSYQSLTQLDKFIQLFGSSMGHHNTFAQQRPEAAALCYDDALFHKGFLLQAAIQIQNMALKDTASAELFNLYKSCQRRLAIALAYPRAERTDADTLQMRINELEKILAGNNLVFGEAMRQVNWQQVKTMLQPGEAAIEFVHYDTEKDSARTTQYAALVLTPDSPLPHYVPLCDGEILKGLLGNTGNRGLNYVKSIYHNPTHKLYDLCWKAIAAVLPKPTHTVYYAPTGLLHRLNLAAISMPLGDDLLATTTLGEKYKLVQFGSTRQLLATRRSAAPLETGNMALFGNISYSMDTTALMESPYNATLALRGEATFSAPDSSLRGESWKELKGTELEIRNIQALANQAGISTTTYTGHMASEEALKLFDGQAPEVLHVATHGFFYTGQSAKLSDQSGLAFKCGNQPLMRSGLIMAGGKYAWENGKPYKPYMEDGILTAYEVSQMDLNGTELVVLSACETALGDVAGHEGVFGLQRAFKIAGAKYLIMSLWQVRDRETQELMSAFYHHWLEKKQGIPEAFRSAQAEIRAMYPHPYFWAGFVLME